MNHSISSSDGSSSDVPNENNESQSEQHSSAAIASLASSLAATSFSDERRCTSHRRVKTTSFDKVFIYEFSLTMGDNPAVREGCPITLSNECINTNILDLNHYERRPGIQKRRRGKDLYIPVYDRAALLMSQGFTLERIVETVLEVERIKKSRHECMKLNGWQKLNYAIDSAGKSIIRKLTNGNGNKSKWTNDKNSTSITGVGDSMKGRRDQKVARMA